MYNQFTGSMFSVNYFIINLLPNKAFPLFQLERAFRCNSCLTLLLGSFEFELRLFLENICSRVRMAKIDGRVKRNDEMVDTGSKNK